MNLNPQEPAQGIMLDNSYSNAKYYTVSCTCGNPHDQIKLEVGSEDGVIDVHVWTTVKTDWWQQAWPIEDRDYSTWRYHVKYAVNAVTSRAKIIWRILTKGYVKMESWTILNQQQALNLAWVLHENVKKLQDKQDLTKEEKIN